jgi:hypothetical protein
MTSEVDMQKRIAEQNCDRCLRFTLYGALAGGVIGVLIVWMVEVTSIWICIAALLSGASGAIIHQITRTQAAACPACGGSWEMKTLNHRMVPNTKFYLKNCPFCLMQIPHGKGENANTVENEL